MRTLAVFHASCLLLLVPAAVLGQTTAGLAASPNPVIFNLPAGSGQTAQAVAITFNGSPVTITGVSYTTTTNQNWLQASVSGTGLVIATVNPAGLSGPFVGNVFATTVDGSISVAVNLTVGTAPPATPAPPSLILALTALAAAALYRVRQTAAAR